MGRGRLQLDFLDRVEAFSDRCLDVAEKLRAEGRFVRVVQQLAGSGTSIGANIAEASEAMSRRDFRKCLSIAKKEMARRGFGCGCAFPARGLPSLDSNRCLTNSNKSRRSWVRP